MSVKNRMKKECRKTLVRGQGGRSIPAAEPKKTPKGTRPAVDRPQVYTVRLTRAEAQAARQGGMNHEQYRELAKEWAERDGKL